MTVPIKQDETNRGLSLAWGRHVLGKYPGANYVTHHEVSMGKRIEEFGEVLLKIPVLYAGWELDQVAWVVRNSEGALNLIMSTQGSLYVADTSALMGKIREYINATDLSLKALELLKE